MSQRAKAKQATYESETSVGICSAKATPAAMKMRSWTLMDGTRDKLTCEGREEDRAEVDPSMSEGRSGEAAEESGKRETVCQRSERSIDRREDCKGSGTNM